jgi:hypothetical protein
MEPRFVLPAEIVEGANIRGNEYGWPPAIFPKAARRAARLGYACLGVQFQFRARAGTCEMYWPNADATDRREAESWRDYCERSRVEVMRKFEKIVAETDFTEQAAQWQPLRSEMDLGVDILSTLVFVADFVKQSES